MSEVTAQKEALRRQLRLAVAGLSPSERSMTAAAVVQRITTEARWQRARTVLLFVPLTDEVDVFPLLNQALAHRKVVMLPRFNGQAGAYEAARISNLATDIVPGRFGVPEPAAACAVCPLNQLDVTLVPGLGFDRVGRRLGRGKGFYDRLLNGASGEFWGIGHDCQLVAELPGESHDVVLNCIVTPAHWMEVVSARR